MNLQPLLDRAKSGQPLGGAELLALRDALGSKDSLLDPYTVIHILWKARDQGSRDMLVSSLAHEDELVRRIAVQAVADLWPSDDAFWLICTSFEQDPSKYVRMAAATAIGDLGAAQPTRAPQAAKLLLDGLSRQPREGPEWEACYEGLLNLVQWPVANRPPATEPLKVADFEQCVITAARNLVSKNC